MNRYLVFADKRFWGKARRELSSMVSSHGIKEEKKVFSDRFFIVETAADQNALLERVHDSVFIDNIIPIVAEIQKQDEKKIENSLQGAVKKGRSFKIEVLRTNSGPGDNAKTIEVKLGKRLESDGYAVDLATPDEYIYVVLHKQRAIIGRLESKFAATGAVDAFRVSNKAGTEISRAEFKLAEAISTFNIDMEAVDQALDIGAAPGGWTNYLSKLGVKTIAVDKAPLDYNVISKNGKIAVIADEKEAHTTNFNFSDIQKAKEGFDVVHIRAMAGKLDDNEISMFGKFDMLLIDANIAPKESATLAARLSQHLSSGAYLIMTIKLVNSSIDKHIGNVKTALNDAYTSIRIKKLPHNRMELTCFAVKR